MAHEIDFGDSRTWGVAAVFVTLLLICFAIILFRLWWSDGYLVQKKMDDRAAWERQQRQLETAKQREILRRKEAAALRRKETRAHARALKKASENKSQGRTVS